MTKVLLMSEMVTEMKPVWSDFIVALGYTRKKGDLFAEGYAEELAKLPTLHKLAALEQQDDRCMKAGFEKAKISEKEALKRFNSGKLGEAFKDR